MKYLILGASSDMAQATAVLLAKQGHELILAARRSDVLEPMARDLHVRFGVQVQVRVFDAQDFARHADFYRELKPKPDVVISFFGYLGDQERSFEDMGECQRVIDVNLTGQISILNLVAQDFQKRKSGLIVGVGSVAGDRGRKSNFIYGAAKAGFEAYLSGLRNALFEAGVHVITVKPGFIATKMTAGMPFPNLLKAGPEKVAKDICHAIQTKKHVIYTPWFWRIIMGLIKALPETLFKRLNL